MSISRDQKLYDALKRIGSYMLPEKLRKNSQRLYGLDGDEAIEMAYENVIQEAKIAIRGMKRPTEKMEPKMSTNPETERRQHFTMPTFYNLQRINGATFVEINEVFEKIAEIKRLDRAAITQAEGARK